MDLLEVFKDSDDLIQLVTGSVLFEEGQDADFMYVIVDGELELSLSGNTLARVQPGAMIGEMALVSSDVRSATATAYSDCLLAPIDVHSFSSLIQHTPEFALHVMNVLVDRLKHTNAALVELSSSQ
jgi:CRP/FNR family cyclic AMP-dependent transcriptional regulator